MKYKLCIFGRLNHKFAIKVSKNLELHNVTLDPNFMCLVEDNSLKFVDKAFRTPSTFIMYRLRPFGVRLARSVAQQQKRNLSIHEYLSADLLRKSGVGVPYGAVATTAAEAEAIAKKIGGDDMVSWSAQ